MSSVAFACTYYKGKFKVTDASNGGNHKTTYGMGNSNPMLYCLTGEASNPETPLELDGNNTINLHVTPYDCNQDLVDEYLGDGKGGPGPTPFSDPNGLYDVNYARLIPGTPYWGPEGNPNDCMTPLLPNPRVVVNRDAMAVNNGNGTATLTLPGPGEYTVCVSGQAPNAALGQPFQYDAIQNSVKVL